jgi:hypothetical protein
VRLTSAPLDLGVPRRLDVNVRLTVEAGKQVGG